MSRKYFDGFELGIDVYLIKKIPHLNTPPSIVKGKIIYRGTKKLKFQ